MIRPVEVRHYVAQSPVVFLICNQGACAAAATHDSAAALTPLNQAITQNLFAFRAIQQYWIRDMFDALKAQLATAGEKLAHLRRFL